MKGKGKHLTLSVVRKEFRHIFRDKVSCLLLFVMPSLIILFLSYAIPFEVNHLDIYVCNPGHSVRAERLFAHVDASPRIRVTGRLERLDGIEPSFAQENTRAVLLYQDNGIDLFIEATNPLISRTVEEMLSIVIGDFVRSEVPQPGNDRPDVKVRYFYNPTLNKYYTPVPGLVLTIFILICSVVLGVSINKEKAQGSWRLLRLTKMTSLQIVVGKALPYLLISLLHVVSVYLICLHFDIVVVGSLPLFILLCLVYSICCMSLGILIASWFDRPLDVLILCWILLFIPNVFLSGFIFPLNSTASLVRVISEILPGTAFITAFRNIAYKGTGLVENLPYFGILTGEMLAAVIFSLIGFRRRISR